MKRPCFALWFAVLAGAGSLQAAEHAAPQEFAPGVISTGREFTLAFTPDGREVCFTRATQGKPLHIFCSRLVDGVWQTAQPISFSNDRWSDLDPFITQDGRRVFFVSTQPHGQGAKNMDIWVAEREGDGWGTPRPVENVNSAGKEGSPAVASDGTMYLFSDRGRAPNHNSIYEAHGVNGGYAEPTALPAPVNSAGSDTSPWVTPDGKLMLFYSDRDGGFGGGDVYVAHRKHGAWQVPVNLGPAVNTAEDEYNPELSRDGRQLFFGRNGRIYVVPVEAVAPLHKHGWRL